ncbi:MAG: HAE1 family hydrophobic/amphiphilic exporter-1 [Candidatus Promineifilaceae bacterium]|jgi:HAE1 family hydrophobic/amphiphilic exporter-1
MKIVERCIQFPVTVAVGVILVVLFGILSLMRIPVQLTPDVDTPQITVETLWPGASPNEVEREIVDRQEDKLKNVEGLLRMKSESKDSVGTIVMEFDTGADMEAARLRVANALDQVERKPDLAEEPVITGVDPTANAIAWITVKRLPGNETPMNTYRSFCEDNVKAALERVPGVARSNIFGGTEQELRVTVDPNKLSAMRISMAQVMNALRAENRNISAGDFDEGKRRYVVRTLGQFASPADAESVIIARQGDRIVRLADVGSAEMAYAKADFNVRHFGSPSIAINCQRAAGANVIQVMNGVKRTIRELNEGPMRDAQLSLKQVYDETIYIESAISLVRQNIMVGGVLAVIVLFLFLRSFSAVGVIAVAIPVSIVGTFLLMSAMGRNINVISLAGMSFAVGMVVDNAIVVLENIIRHRQMGKDLRTAAREGADEVWGAVLASTLTTMAVFVPIVFMEEEIGQLYRDIAIAISGAVALSMIVAISVIPTLCARVGGRNQSASSDAPRSRLDRFGAAFTGKISNAVYWICGSVRSRIIVTVALTASALLLARVMTPPAEYLPSGNRNLIFCILLPPPGYNLDELAGIGRDIETELKPHFRYYDNQRMDAPESPVIGNFFFVARGRSVFMGAIAEDDSEARKLIPLLQEPLSRIPGMIAIVQQSSLFGRGIGEGRNIDIEITGPELEQLVGMAGGMFGQLFGVLPGSMNRPIPSLDLGNPEVHIVPDRVRLAKRGLSTADLGMTVDILLDGRKIDDYKHAGEEIDLVLSGLQNVAVRSQDFEQLPIVTPDGDIVPLGDLANVILTSGPEQINHIERRRAITIRVIPPAETPMDVAMDTIESKIVDPLRASGATQGGYQIKLAGTADDLVVTLDALKWNFLLAVVIAYLLMAALFESFLYPLVIMFSVPLAAVGGLLGLKLVNVGLHLNGSGLDQPMDTLTMLGFIILVGTVINNAILIVHQALNHIRRDKMPDREAIRESVRTRIRPIFMSMTTSVLGMMPLVLFPGAGSELYRGIGGVVIGGLFLSTVFTLILIPSLLSLVLTARHRLHDLLPQRFRDIAIIALALSSIFAVPAMAETESQETPALTNGTLVISLDRCMALTLGGNIAINIESRLPLIVGDDFFIAEEKFVPRFSGDVEFVDREERTANTQLGADVFKQETLTSEARVSKTWSTGTRTDLVWAYERREDNSQFRTLNPAHDNAVIFEITQPLLQGFGGRISRLDIERAVKRRSAADKEYQMRLEAELLTAYQRYWDLVIASTAVTYQEFATDLAQREAAFVAQRVEVGDASGIQHKRAIAERDAARQALMQSRANHLRASTALMQQMSPAAENQEYITLVASTRFSGQEITQDPAPVSEAVLQALEKRPEIGLYDLALSLSAIDVLEANDKRRAKLDLRGAMGPNGLGSDFSESVSDLDELRNEWRIGLSLAFLFDSESRRARWRQAVLQEESAELRVKLARSTIISEVRTALADLDASASALTTSRQRMRVAEDRLTRARTRRGVGLITDRDVIRFERDAAAAAYQLAQSQSQHLLAYAIHQASMGGFTDWILGSPGQPSEANVE